MRVIKELHLEGCRVTLFSWNNRYIIKLEQGLLEQTFKVDQFDLLNEEALIRLIDASFVEEASRRFIEMGASLEEARQRMMQ
jgi:hypothetical protein